MDGGHYTELILLSVLLAVVGLALVARVVAIPYPILFVIGGLALGFLPGTPAIELNPDLVLVIFLPPLLYSAAFFSSLRGLRANLRPISLLSIGLVLATTCAVALVAHTALGFSWPVAFVLGAIVSPTDPVAATAIARRLGVPRRVVTIVEGESLINDGTALIAYRVAVVAVASGTFSAWEAGLLFVVNGVAGIAIGLAVGWVVAQVRRRIEDPLTEISISLATPFFAYLPAEVAGVSAVLAAVTVGIYLGWRAPELVSPTTRLQAFAVWEVLVFILNSLLFVMVGLQLPGILDELSGESAGTLIGYGAIVGATVVLVRIAWVFPVTYLPSRLFRAVRERDPLPPWQSTFLVAWSGMRGAVSLAAALALPLETDSGAPFPDRALVIFLTFAVIVVTLVLQGLSLPPLIRALGVEDDGAEAREEVEARVLAAEAALERISALAAEDWVREDTADRARAMFDYRRRRFVAQADGEGSDGYEERASAYVRLMHELLEAQRAVIVGLRNDGRISDDVMHRVERDLDLEHSRFLEGS